MPTTPGTHELSAQRAAGTGAFTGFAWGVLVYNLAVVLWGAYVRASGSGAGCGEHWPLCNGEVLPRSTQAATLIEFTHRAMSGLALLSVVALLAWAFRLFPRGHRVRTGAVVANVFMLTEALIGAGLVLFGQVAQNASMTRAWSLSIHLTNTFILLAVIALTARWASGGPPVSLQGQSAAAVVLGLALLGTIVLGISGAIAALGDTLFPASSLVQGLRQDFSPAAHIFLRLRIWHPIIAALMAGFLLLMGGMGLASRGSSGAKLFGGLLFLLIPVQLGAGFLNLLLRAPIWMQLVHLFLADLVWITLVLLAASLLVRSEPAAERAAR